ncbi:MAG: serine hydrolase, partial [Thermaerobacterales bacterium]
EKASALGNLATPYVPDKDGRLLEGEIPQTRNPGASGVISCTDDLARFVRAFLDRGRAVTGVRLFDSDLLDVMMTPRIALPYVPDPAFGPITGIETLAGDVSGGGGGWHTGVFQVSGGFFGGRVAGHGGGVAGGTAYLAFVPEHNLGVTLLANGHGYPLGQLALYCLTTMAGGEPHQLPFLHSAVLSADLSGTYESFRRTIQARIDVRGDFLDLRLVFHHEERLITLVPFDLTPEAPRFFTLNGGRRVVAEFRRSSEGVELLYERYKFRKIAREPDDALAPAGGSGVNSENG